MLEEGDPKIRAYITDNIYRSFASLIIEFNSVPKEFAQGTKELDEYHKKEIHRKGDDAMEDQLKEFINQLRDDYDPGNYISKLLEILNQNKAYIDEDLYEDLITYIRHGKKRRKS